MAPRGSSIHLGSPRGKRVASTSAKKRAVHTLRLTPRGPAESQHGATRAAPLCPARRCVGPCNCIGLYRCVELCHCVGCACCACCHSPVVCSTCTTTPSRSGSRRSRCCSSCCTSLARSRAASTTSLASTALPRRTTSLNPSSRRLPPSWATRFRSHGSMVCHRGLEQSPLD